MGRSSSVVLVLLFSLLPASLAGQAGTVWLEPHGSWGIPTGDLGRTAVLANNGYGDFGDYGSGLSLGLAGGVEVGGGLAVRASVDRVFDTDVEGQWLCVPFIACPAVVVPLDGEASRWSAAVDVQYRPGAELPVAPVLSAGIGIARTRVDWAEPDVDFSLPAMVFEDTTPMYRVGLGAERGLGRTVFFAEVAGTLLRFGGPDYQSIEGDIPADISKPTTQFDVAVGGGFRIRVR